jgi:hypothetical protein
MMRPREPGVAQVDLVEVERFVSGCAMNFPTHAEALDRLVET